MVDAWEPMQSGRRTVGRQLSRAALCLSDHLPAIATGAHETHAQFDLVIIHGRVTDGACRGTSPRHVQRTYFTLVLFDSITSAHLPSGPCIAILKVYAVGESSVMVTRVFTFLPPIVLSSL